MLWMLRLVEIKLESIDNEWDIINMNPDKLKNDGSKPLENVMKCEERYGRMKENHNGDRGDDK